MICDKIILTPCVSVNCNRHSVCIMSHDNRGRIVCKENKKAYILVNDKKILITNFHMDGGIIDDSNQKKCDYLIYIPSTKKIILIELKGAQFSNAIAQILATLDIYNDNLKDCQVFARIIGQGVPNIRNASNYIMLEKQIQRRGGNVVSKTNTYIEQESKMSNV